MITDNRFKIAGLLIAPVLVFGAGYWYGQSKPAVVKTEYQERTVFKDRIVVRSEQREELTHQTRTVKKANGTTITTETTKQAKDQVSQQEQTKTVDHSVRAESSSTLSPKHDYSLGLNISPTKDYKSVESYQVYGARRILGNVWVQGTVSGKGEFTVGLRIDF
jgi:hypothetical protein